MQPQIQSPEWNFPIFLFKYKAADSLPAFHSPKVKKIVIESSSINSISNISKHGYPCLEQYTVKFNKTLMLIPLVDTTNIEKINIHENSRDRKTVLSNTCYFKKYSNLKDVYVRGLTFEDPFMDKEEEKMLLSQIKGPEISQQVSKVSQQQTKDVQQTFKKEQPSKPQLYKLMNPKKYPKYLENHFGIEPQQHQVYSYKVDIQNNDIKTLPQFAFKQVKQLMCSYNRICSLEEFAKGSYPSLKIVNFSSNTIKSVPYLNMPSVQVLTFSINKIQSIDEFATASYPKLHTLYLDSNQLKSLPKLDTVSLNDINLSCNQLSDVEGFFSGCYPQIKKLFIKGQYIKSFKAVNLPKLKTLDLSSNQISQIPILNTPLLKSLLLANNKIVDTLSLKNDSLTLESLELQQNYIEILHPFNTSKLKQLNLSDNYMQNFHEIAQIKFPILQNLKMTALRRSRHIAKMPKLKMPLIKTINFTYLQSQFQEDFFEGVYENLQQMILGRCQNLTKLPQIKSPKLRSIIIQQTKIEDISDFLKGSYPALQRVQLPRNLILMLDKHNNAEQLVVHRKTEKPIVHFDVEVNSVFRSVLFQKFLRKIDIDLEMVLCSEFISFLNLIYCRQLNFRNVRNQSEIIKSLAKNINFYSSEQTRYIQIRSKQSLNILHFAQPLSLLPFYAENDHNWRRSYSAKRPMKWTIKGEELAYGWKKNNYELKMELFENRLTGTNHKQILQKAKKHNSNKISKQSRLQDPLQMFERNEMRMDWDEFQEYEYEDINHYYYRHSLFNEDPYLRRIRHNFQSLEDQTQWRSPRMITRGYDRQPSNSYQFNNLQRITQVTKRFFRQLRCPLAETYLGEGCYWFFYGFGQCGGAPTFFVRTIDGGACQFVESFGMIKITQMGVSHFFENKQDSSSSEVCIDCLTEVGKLMRQIFAIQRKQCPLADIEQNIQDYRSMANSGNTIRIKM